MKRLPTALLFLATLPVLFAGGLRADEEVEEIDPKKGMVPDPEVSEVDREKAKVMLDALDDAVKSKEVEKVLAELGKFVSSRNEKFVKPLDKLTRNRSESVRILATKALGSQTPAKKVGPLLFRILQDRTKVNKKCPRARAVAVEGLRRIRFDKKLVYEELKSEFRKVNDPEIMRESARYFGDLQKMDAVKMLIYWVEAPQPANPNSDTNPPASYWKRMWEVWNAIHVYVLDALKRLTGKDFKSKYEWEAWSRSDEAKRMGV